MVLSSPEQTRIFEQLVSIAWGDAELVRRAIRAVSADGRTADIRKVVDYIKQHREWSNS